MSSPLRHVFALGCVLAVTAPLAAAPLRVLFLGNSLTAGNDVPALVQAMALLQGVDLQYTALHPGGYAIEDHWRDGHQARLQTGDYDVLVLQQGPSTLPDSQAHLRSWTITWAAEARRFGTRPALYMIWPVRTQPNGFALVSESYRNAALAADAVVFPAGEAWQAALRADPSVQLYSGDDLHARPAGSFLAAMVIARGLVSLDPARVPASVRGITVPAATLASFRAVVDALPAATLTGLASAGSGGGEPPPGTTLATPPTPAPAAPAPATGSRGSGGGAPSLWFFLALMLLGTARLAGTRVLQSHLGAFCAFCGHPSVAFQWQAFALLSHESTDQGRRDHPAPPACPRRIPAPSRADGRHRAGGLRDSI